MHLLATSILELRIGECCGCASQRRSSEPDVNLTHTDIISMKITGGRTGKTEMIKTYSLLAVAIDELGIIRKLGEQVLCKSLDAEVDGVVRGRTECSLGRTVREDSLPIPCKKKKRREKVSEFECSTESRF